MKIKGFETLEEIGRGKFAVVYKVQSGSSVFALKTIKIANDQQGLMQALRFRKEAAVLARMQHPGLPKIEEVGEFNGNPFILMELAPGEGLDKILQKQGRLSEQATIEIAKILSGALAAVHRIGVAHRDIKPENIIYDGNKSVKLIDFGFTDEIKGGKRQDETIGTFLYAPPEQTGMLHRSVDQRADLYSLGAVLYECISGHPMYQGSSATELIKMHASSPVPIVNAQSPELAAIITKLIQKDPDHRYQSAFSLLHDLQALGELKQDSRGAYILDSVGRDLPKTNEVKLVGREKEMAVLNEALEKAQVGLGTLVQIEGEGGSGKSRLCQELISHVAHKKSLVLRGKCQAAESVPLGVLREVIDDFALSLLRLPAEQQAAEFQKVKTAAGTFGGILRRLSRGLESILTDAPEVSPLEAANERDRSFRITAEFLNRLAADYEVMIVLIDDIQWLDSSSLEVLRRFSSLIKNSKIVFLTTARNDSDSMPSTTAFINQIGERVVHRVTLSPLTKPDVAVYILAFLGSGTVEQNIVDRMTEVTNGNAFALGEYIRLILDEGVMAPVGAKWVADDQRLHELTISQNVVDLVCGRVNSLSQETVQILGFAAVSGGEFDDKLLSRAVGNENTVIRNLDEAVHNNLIEQNGSRYAFVHDRIRESLINKLSVDQQKAIHQRWAEVLESADITEEVLFALARHYISGHFEKNLQKIYDICLKAGGVALEAYSYGQAFDLLSKSAQARTDLHAQGISTQGFLLDEFLGQATLRLVRLKEAQEHFKVCLQKAKSKTDLGRIHYFICLVELAGGDVDRAYLSLLRAYDYLGSPIPKRTWEIRAEILLLRPVAWFLGTTGFFKGISRNKQRRQLISKMISPCSQITYISSRFHVNNLCLLREFINAHLMGYPLEIARASAYFAFFQHNYCNIKLIRRYGHLAVTLSEQIGDWGVHAFCRHQFGVAALFGGDEVEAERQFREAIPFMKEYLGFRDASVTVVNLSVALQNRGLTRESLEILAREQEVMTKTNSAIHRLMAASTAYSQCMLMGRVNEAAEHLKETKKAPQWVRDVVTTKSSVLGCELEVALNQMDFSANTETLIEDLFRLDTINYYSYHAYVTAAYIRLNQWLAKKDGADASSALANLKKSVRILKARSVRPVPKAHYHVLRSAVACAEGHQKKAMNEILKAEKIAELCDNRWAQFEIACQKARIYAALRDQNQTHTHAKTAMEFAHRQGWKSRAVYVQREFAIERTNNEHEQFQRAEIYTESLLRVSIASASSLDPAIQSRAVLDELISVVAAERAFLFLAQPNSTAMDPELKLYAGRDSTGKDLEALIGYSSTVVRKVSDTRKPILVSGTESGEVLLSESAVTHSIRSIMAAPLIWKGEFRGVVYLDSRVAKGIFVKADLKFLEALSNHIAVALQTAEMARLELERRELQRDRLVMEKTLQSAMSAEMAGLIRSGEVAISRFGEARDITILFCDLSGFTPLSESTGAEILVAVLNDYLDQVVDLIYSEQGYVDKFIGDGVMAFWGAPVKQPDHANRAIQMALRYERVLEKFNVFVREKYQIQSEFSGRIGIHTGRVIVGNIGSQKRHNYTAVGDGVNLAARLESLCKMYDLKLLISEGTMSNATEKFQGIFEVDRVKVKGRIAPTRIYSRAAAELASEAAAYEEGLGNYYLGKWKEALACFGQAQRLPCTQTMVTRCLQGLEKGSPDNWKDGVWILGSK